MPEETLSRELRRIYSELRQFNSELESPKIAAPMDALQAAADATGRAWCGSWFGYHANVYYRDLQAPPPGAHFSAEWGLKPLPVPMGTTGTWREYSRDAISEAILQKAGKPDTRGARKAAQRGESLFDLFDDKRDAIISILHAAISQRADPYLQGLLDEAKTLRVLDSSQVIQNWQPKGTLMSRDTTALSQGLWTPPHLGILARITSWHSAFAVCMKLEKLALSGSSHLERVERLHTRQERLGTKVFIGHGQSKVWRDLKDFVQDRLQLPWDEFNRVPVAGITNIARLSEMLDSAAIAFIVMTGEDEQIDGTVRAQMNVVHEAGLFQGRLGFTKAIVLLEEGCEEFSNIEGLGQIRFPKGSVAAAFEEIRQVLERESII